MLCALCKKDFLEGNDIHYPDHKQTPHGMIATILHVIGCDSCCAILAQKYVNQKLIFGGKVVDAEIVS